MDEQVIQSQLKQQGQTLNEIRDALLGSLDGSKVGLIEDHRVLKKQVDTLSVTTQVQGTLIASQQEEIKDLKGFKANIMKIVAFCGLVIPVLFEIGKGLFMLGWEYLKNLGHK